MSPSRQRFTFDDRCRQTPIMDWMALVDLSVRANVGGTPSRSTVRVSARPSQAGGDPRVSLVQLAGQGLELRLGEQCTVGVVGGAHLGSASTPRHPRRQQAGLLEHHSSGNAAHLSRYQLLGELTQLPVAARLPVALIRHCCAASHPAADVRLLFARRLEVTGQRRWGRRQELACSDCRLGRWLPL